VLADGRRAGIPRLAATSAAPLEGTSAAAPGAALPRPSLEAPSRRGRRSHGGL